MQTLLNLRADSNLDEREFLNEICEQEERKEMWSSMTREQFLEFISDAVNFSEIKNAGFDNDFCEIGKLIDGTLLESWRNRE